MIEPEAGAVPRSAAAAKRIVLPEPSLVLLVGPSSSGKSTFARRHFAATEVLASDAFRALVADDENDQSATDEAFEVLHHVAGLRLARGRLTVVDATNLQLRARQPLLALARRCRVPCVAIVLAVPGWLIRQRNVQRTDRRLEPRVLARQSAAFRRSIGSLAGEGFDEVWILDAGAIDSAVVERAAGRPA